MMKAFTIFIAYVLILTATSCHGHRSGARATPNYLNDSAIMLNNKAVDLIKLAGEDSGILSRDSLLLLAISDLNEAIGLDTLYQMAYINKTQALRLLHRNHEAIEVTEHLLAIEQKPEYYFALGVTYERIGDTLQAGRYYREAISHYDSQLAADKDSVGLMVNRYFTMLFLSPKDSVIHCLQAERKISDDANWPVYKALFDEFDRKQFVETF